MSFWYLFPAVFALTYLLTKLLRRYALAASMIDVPNARSSHSTPTPRGGGLSIVLVSLLALPLLGWYEFLSWSEVMAFSGTGAVVAVIGFLDDHGHIPARWRLIGHFSAAIWGLVWIGGLPPLILFGFSVDLSWLGHVLAAVYLVWVLNLYNFMDGIDGLASVEAIFVCLGGALLYGIAGMNENIWLPATVACAVAGFLVWNFPPAKIFMGDAGSGYLGIVLGLMALQAAWVSPQFFWSWLIFLGIFVVDATLTLLRRLLRGEKVYEAHRSHAYQFASRQYGRHLPVTLWVTAINLFWLLPVGLLVGMGMLDGCVGLLVAYLPLSILAVKFRAGSKEA
ncbi:MraY family glycosyltransferase [Pseudomonas wadenswilerensis]|uniref:Phospho-N-acetylmuramoyl-pentapeptide-transferas e n=1 Tax=Pseudomonas wadenswilerensis TaxID=1785161 RepID=A0A380SX29_9PSED|nr:glycosyltransferase family 4 protein [Pseudomonas wadenswilerensis]SUQ62154.1 Phospho-N-acetylmuramoyl-pentapeptide-transferas e [Pseudomonas wadenswilerensis]